MQDKRSIILILVSSRCFDSFFRRLIMMKKFLVSSVSFFLFWSFKFSRLSLQEASSFRSQGVWRKSLQGFNLVFFKLHVLPIIFFPEAHHGGSSRILFILVCSSRFILEVKIRQAILRKTHDVQHMFCFRSSSFLQLAFRSANSFSLIFWGGVMSFLTISLRGSWFTSCQEWDILNPSFSLRSGRSFQPIKFFVRVILG